MVTEDENEAKKLSEFKNNSAQSKVLAKDKTTLFESEKGKDELNIIIKSDVQGSNEAMAINESNTMKLRQKLSYQILEW